MTLQERNNEISRLSEFFGSAALPQPPIKIGDYMTIYSLETYINTNLLRASNDATMSETCILRLQQLEKVLADLSNQK